MKVAIVIDGPSKKLITWIEHYTPNARQAIRQAFFRLGKELKRKANKEILDKTKKTGRVYWVYKNGHRRKHQASAPGETHANLTGDLRRSLSWQVHGTDELVFGYGAADDGGGHPVPEYADRIENGGFGRWGNYIDARPSLKNATQNTSFDRFFEQELARLESK